MPSYRHPDSVSLPRPSAARLAPRMLLLALAVTMAACGASKSFNRGETSSRLGEWDTAVEHYRKAVQEEPTRADYKLALERAMITGGVNRGLPVPSPDDAAARVLN